MLKKRRPSTEDDDDEEDEESESSSEEDRPIRKRLNRIDSDEDEDGGEEEEHEEEEEETKTKGDSTTRPSRVSRDDNDDDVLEKGKGQNLSPSNGHRASRSPIKPGASSPAVPRDSAGSSGKQNGPSSLGEPEDNDLIKTEQS